MTSTEPSPEPLRQLVDEALVHRLKHGLLPLTATPAEIFEKLNQVRVSLDRVEELLAVISRYRTGTARELADATARAEEAWNRAARAGTSGSMRDVAPRERYADYELGILELRIVEREARERDREAEAAVGIVRNAHRGLDGLRYDLNNRLSAVTRELPLDRQAGAS